MWIQTDNTATVELWNEDLMDEPVEFTENGKAQVPEVVGEALVNEYDDITESETS